MSSLLIVLTLWGSTLGIIAIDKSMRAAKRSEPVDGATFAEEPGWGVLIALCILVNIATLPYYFYATRRSIAWGFIGFLGFVACLVAMFGVGFVVALTHMR